MRLYNYSTHCLSFACAAGRDFLKNKKVGSMGGSLRDGGQAEHPLVGSKGRTVGFGVTLLFTAFKHFDYYSFQFVKVKKSGQYQRIARFAIFSNVRIS